MIDSMFEIMAPVDLEHISEKKFLEPCVGTGNFVIAYLMKLYEFGFTEDVYKKIIDNIYVSDVSIELLNIYEETLSNFVKTIFNISLDEEYFKTHTSQGLLFNLNVYPKYIRIEDAFPGIGKFDIIVTNPPYKNLKAEMDQFIDASEYEKMREKYELVRGLSSRILRYSTHGVLNLYKLFTEEIFEKYGGEDCIISLLVPNTILSDKTCENLRTRILESGKLYRVDIIRENNSFIDAQQGLCTMLIRKNMKTDYVKINKDFCENRDNHVVVDIDDIMCSKTGNSIMVVGEKEYSLLKKLRNFKTISDFPFIYNMRGELDLTANRESITTEKNKAKLLRGKHISMFQVNLDSNEYVVESFVEKSKKKCYIMKPRIVCQQVSNLQKNQRIQYAPIEAGFVVANSCNFISVDDNKYGIDLYFLLGLLNSPTINWLFKLTSSNNHINNYEIDSFPVPTDLKGIRKVSRLVKLYLQSKDQKTLNEINETVNFMFGISESEEVDEKDDDIISGKYYLDMSCIIPSIKKSDTDAIISERSSLETFFATNECMLSGIDKEVCVEITKKFISLKKKRVMNHITSKLSDLDLEIIKCIPPGGNWKNISEDTRAKSKRLQQIASSGGRTTLYGRIDYDQPSYTISTYFNRPGNGTFVHPKHDRMISFREAARFQSFKDDYCFTGSRGEILKQIGNAVPPLLSKQIGETILKKTDVKKSLDLFCGAGGLTVGLKEAGMKTVLATDFNRSACITCKVNSPEIPILCGDITDEGVKSKIVEISLLGGVEMVCGGPPCQGFSLAGKRFIDDPRNQLFKHFIDVVSRIRPKIVLMENVEGILSFEHGATYGQILSMFNDLGYYVDGRTVIASNYGVPQKRKRVIIIGTRSDLEITPSALYPEESSSKESFVNARDVLSDLEAVECRPDAEYVSTPESTYGKEMRSMEKYGKHIDKQDIKLKQTHLI